MNWRSIRSPVFRLMGWNKQIRNASSVLLALLNSEIQTNHPKLGFIKIVFTRNRLHGMNCAIQPFLYGAYVSIRNRLTFNAIGKPYDMPLERSAQAAWRKVFDFSSRMFDTNRRERKESKVFESSKLYTVCTLNYSDLSVLYRQTTPNIDISSQNKISFSIKRLSMVNFSLLLIFIKINFVDL